MAFPWIPLAGLVLSSFLGSQQKSAKPKSIPRLTPEQQAISRQVQGNIGRGLRQDYSALQGTTRGALQGILGGGAYGGLTTPDPRFAAKYGTMGLRAIGLANQAILAREGQRLQGVPLAQQLWQGPQKMALNYLNIPMMDTYLEQPAPNPLMQLLGTAAPYIGGAIIKGLPENWLAKYL